MRFKSKTEVLSARFDFSVIDGEVKKLLRIQKFPGTFDVLECKPIRKLWVSISSLKANAGLRSLVTETP